MYHRFHWLDLEVAVMLYYVIQVACTQMNQQYGMTSPGNRSVTRVGQ